MARKKRFYPDADRRRVRGPGTIRYDRGREPLTPQAARVLAKAFELSRMTPKKREAEIEKLAVPEQMGLPFQKEKR